MSRAQIVDHYIMQSTQKGFEIDQVRKELEANNVPEEEIRVIVQMVDKEVRESAVFQSKRKQGTQLIVAGSILVVVGLLIIAISYIYDLDFQQSYVLLYGPVVGGASLIFTGLAKRRGEEDERKRKWRTPKKISILDHFSDGL